MKPLDGGAEEIARALGGHRSGGGWSCHCPAHEDRAPSLSVTDGADGRLLVRCFAGCSFEDILAALRGLGLLEGRHSPRPPDPVETARRRAAEAAEAEKRRRQAAACWAETLPVTGTLAEAYLRARGIRCALPPTLRFHPDCWHKSAKRLPAMVAGVQGVDGRGLGVQRTYLAEPGVKAAVEPQKVSLGPIGGGAVRLCRGPGALLVCEGVETGLALVDALAADRGVSVWVTLGTSGMAGLDLPPGGGELVIAPDGDDAGAEAAGALALRAEAAGWRVRLMAAPGEGRDWNDVASGVAA